MAETIIAQVGPRAGIVTAEPCGAIRLSIIVCISGRAVGVWLGTVVIAIVRPIAVVRRTESRPHGHPGSKADGRPKPAPMTPATVTMPSGHSGGRGCQRAAQKGCRANDCG